MVLDILTGIIAGVGLGGAVGALSAYLGWNASGEPFEQKKFVGGLITGVIAGVTLVVMNIALLKTALAEPSGVAFLETVILLSIGILGVDYARAKLSGIMANREPTPAAIESQFTE